MNLLRLFTGRKHKPVLLDLERYYPSWHKRSGELTRFGSKVLSQSMPKRHSLRVDCSVSDKISTSGSGNKIPLHIVYYTVSNMQLSTILIKKNKSCSVQQAVIPHPEEDFIHIDGKEVPLVDFVQNEGLNEADFREWHKNHGGREAVLIHFGDFRY